MNTSAAEEVKKALGRVKPGDVIHVEVVHQEGCPALKTGRLRDCTCRPEVKVLKPC